MWYIQQWLSIPLGFQLKGQRDIFFVDVTPNSPPFQLPQPTKACRFHHGLHHQFVQCLIQVGWNEDHQKDDESRKGLAPEKSQSPKKVLQEGFCGSMTQGCFSEVPWKHSLTLPRLSLMERQMWAPKPETSHILSTWIFRIRTMTTKECKSPLKKKQKNMQHSPYNLLLTLGKLHYQPASSYIHFKRHTTQLGSPPAMSKATSIRLGL